MANRLNALAAVVLFSAASAQAADRGFYFGVLGGQTQYEFDVPTPIAVPTLSDGPIERPDDEFIPPPSGFVAVNVFPVAISPILWFPGDDDESSAWGVTAGYRMGRYGAVELNYMNLGELKERDLIYGAPITGGQTTLTRELETSGPSLSALGILPVTEHWDLYARAGVFFADVEFTLAVGGGSSSTTFGSEAALWGVGTQYTFGEHWSLRLDFQRFESVGDDNDLGLDDIDLLSLGVLYRL